MRNIRTVVFAASAITVFALTGCGGESSSSSSSGNGGSTQQDPNTMGGKAAITIYYSKEDGYEMCKDVFYEALKIDTIELGDYPESDVLMEWSEGKVTCSDLGRTKSTSPSDSRPCLETELSPEHRQDTAPYPGQFSCVLGYNSDLRKL